MTLKREHVAIGVITIATAFTAGSAFSPIRTAKAACDSGWISQAISDATSSFRTEQPTQRAEDGYYDVRTKKNVQLYPAGQAPATAQVQTYQPIEPLPVVPAAGKAVRINGSTNWESMTLDQRVATVNAEVLAGTYQPRGAN